MSDDNVIDCSNMNLWKDLLKDFQPPRNRGRKTPYVLFGAWKLNNQGVEDGKGGTKYEGAKLKYRLMTLNASGGHGKPAKLQYFINKGYVILDYWFPDKTDLPKQRSQTESSWIQSVRNAEDGVDVFADSKAFCEHHKLNNERKQQLEDVKGIKAKLKAAEAKIAKLENGKLNGRESKASVSEEAQSNLTAE